MFRKDSYTVSPYGMLWLAGENFRQRDQCGNTNLVSPIKQFAIIIITELVD